MSDQHLTVAELLARAAKESQGQARTTRPRRRRSVEEGGVSVAELTGSIPAVQQAPTEPRHTSTPLDSVTQDRIITGENSQENSTDDAPRAGVSTDTAASPAAAADAADFAAKQVQANREAAKQDSSERKLTKIAAAAAATGKVDEARREVEAAGVAVAAKAESAVADAKDAAEALAEELKAKAETAEGAVQRAVASAVKDAEAAAEKVAESARDTVADKVAAPAAKEGTKIAVAAAAAKDKFAGHKTVEGNIHEAKAAVENVAEAAEAKVAGVAEAAEAKATDAKDAVTGAAAAGAAGIVAAAGFVGTKIGAAAEAAKSQVNDAVSDGKNKAEDAAQAAKAKADEVAEGVESKIGEVAEGVEAKIGAENNAAVDNAGEGTGVVDGGVEGQEVNAPSVRTTQVIRAVVDEDEEPAEGADIEEISVAEVDAALAEAYEEDSERPSALGLVLSVIGGIVLGILVFLGFQELWANLNGFVTGILSLLVVAGFLFATVKFLAVRDKLTLALAALAGLLVTFGPALIVGVNI